MRTWLWLLGGGAVVWWMHKRSFGAPLLGSPLETSDWPRATPHGAYGAPRARPPRHRHQGLYLAAPPGSFVLAVGDGVIVATNPGLGRVVRKLRLDAPSAWQQN